MWSDFSPESRALLPSGVNHIAPGGVGWGATRRPCWFLFGLSLPQAGAACHIRKVYFPTSEQSTSFFTRCAEQNLREKHRERWWPNDSTSKTPTAIIQYESDHNFWHMQTPLSNLLIWRFYVQKCFFLIISIFKVHRKSFVSKWQIFAEVAYFSNVFPEKMTLVIPHLSFTRDLTNV